MKNRRFFAFGCSYTYWCWPTWADLIGNDYEEYYNYGQHGAGNHYIFNTFMQADIKHKFSKDDLIIVQFSGITREDRYSEDGWQVKGTILNHPKEFIKNYFDFRGFLIRDMAFIKAIVDALRNLRCEYYLLSMNPFTSKSEFSVIVDDSVNDVIEVYREYIDLIKPSYMETLSYKRPIKLKNGIKLLDSHPLPTDHYAYLEKVLPKYAVNKDLAIKWEDIISTLDGDHNTLWSEQPNHGIFEIITRGHRGVSYL